MYTCYLRCYSVTNINIQRYTKSYNVQHKVHTLERNRNLFIQNPLTTHTINIRFTTVKYYSLMTYNLFDNYISLSECVILSYILAFKGQKCVEYRMFITCISKVKEITWLQCLGRIFYINCFSKVIFQKLGRSVKKKIKIKSGKKLYFLLCIITLKLHLPIFVNHLSNTWTLTK
jgi:hypothetical protein